MKHRFTLAGIAAVLGCTLAYAQSEEELQKQVEDLNKRLQKLEANSRTTSSPSILFLERVSSEDASGVASPVIYRAGIVDRQEAATRPGSQAIDPKYRGFFPVPNTPVIMKINFKPKVDAMWDNSNTGVPYRFVPAKFPLEGSPEAGEDGQFNMSANGSQLRFDLRAPDQPGSVRIYYQNDFFGDDDKQMRYRLQHFYGEFFGVTSGFTYSVWEDPDVWPDTVDYEGPNAVIFARRAVVQYTHQLSQELNITIGLENPDFFVDGGDKTTRMPDIPINLRYEKDKLGHVQLSGIVREIGSRDETGDEQYATGWGINLGTSLKLTKFTAFQFLGVVGEGVGGMGNDTSFLNSDAGYSSDGKLEALPYYSLMAGLTQHWSEEFRSTFTYGYADLDPASGMDDEFFANSTYASANIIWQIRERLSVGLEGLYGFKEVVNGADSGDIYRVQLGMSYSAF